MTDASASAIDLAALNRLTRFGGGTLLSQLVDLFLTEAPRRINDAREGVRAQNADAVRRALHALKSSAGQLGAVVVMEQCSTGESLAEAKALPALGPVVDTVAEAFSVASSRLDSLRRNGFQ